MERAELQAVFVIVFAVEATLAAFGLPRGRTETKRPLSPVNALMYVRGTAAGYPGPLETRIRYLTMSDSELVAAAQNEPDHAILEATARRRPSILGAYVTALDRCRPENVATAIDGIKFVMGNRPESPAQASLTFLLKHRRLVVRASAANALAPLGTKHPSVVPNLIEYVTHGDDGELLLQIGKNLLTLNGPKEHDLILKARQRLTSHPRRSYLKLGFDFLLTEYGDTASANEVRRVALGKGERHDRVMAIQVLCRSRGVKEVETAEKCLVGPGDLRTVAMHWLYHFGQKSSVAKLRASARDPNQDLSGSKAYESIPAQMLDFAARIERGERGPRPPDNYYYRGSSSAWAPRGQAGIF